MAQDEPGPEEGRPGSASPPTEIPPDVDASAGEPEDAPMVHESVPQGSHRQEASSAPQRGPALPDKPSSEEQASSPLPEDSADAFLHNEEDHTASDVENMLHETQSIDEVSRELEEPAEEERHQAQAVDEEKTDIEPLDTEPSAAEHQDDVNVDAESAARERAGLQPPSDELDDTQPIDPESEMNTSQKVPDTMREEAQEAADADMRTATPPSEHEHPVDPAPDVQQLGEAATPDEGPMEVDDAALTEDHRLELQATDGQPTEEELADDLFAGERPAEQQPVEEQFIRDQVAEDYNIEEQSAEDQPIEDHAPEDQPADEQSTEAQADQASTAVAEEEEASDDSPPRIIIIEHLDTPATRREKYLQKRLERQRKQAEAEAAERAARGRAGEDAKSDLSDLSDLSDGGEAPGPADTDEDAGEDGEEPGTVVLGEGESLEGGTLGALPHKFLGY